MVSIDQQDSSLVHGGRSSWFWSQHRQPVFCKQVVSLFFSFEIVLFSIFSVYCTLCILLGFNGSHRPGLKAYAGRDHPDFGLVIGNLDSLQTRERYALIQLLMEFRISWYFIVHLSYKDMGEVVEVGANIIELYSCSSNIILKGRYVCSQGNVPWVLFKVIFLIYLYCSTTSY